jgi:DNA-binding NarL/FixJ family response regulator
MPVRLRPSSTFSSKLGKNRLPSIRILVVEDHVLVRQNLCTLLKAQPDMQVIAEATDGLEAVRKAEEFQPDLVLLDIGLPELSGLHATGLIKKAAPKAEILVVTQYEEQFFARHAFAAGALGFLTKTQATAELIPAVRQVFAGKRFVSRKSQLESKDDDPPAGMA